MESDIEDERVLDDDEEENDNRRNIQGLKRGENRSKMGQDAMNNSQKKRRGGLAEYNQSQITNNPQVIRESIEFSEKVTKKVSPNDSPYNEFAGSNVNRTGKLR